MLDKMYRSWKRVPKVVRQLLVFFVGTTIVITGLLMLILPGPGWAAIFLGFAILATEFTLAEKVRDWLLARLKHLYRFSKAIFFRLLGKTKK